MLQVLPPLAYAAALAALAGIAVARRPPGPRGWMLPAALALAFAVFSGLTLQREGVMQFWVNHSTSLAGNQVWFDLLIAVCLCFALIAPRARAVGMPLWPWALGVAATASLALLPMMARLMWLERRARAD